MFILFADAPQIKNFFSRNVNFFIAIAIVQQILKNVDARAFLKMTISQKLEKITNASISNCFERKIK